MNLSAQLRAWRKRRAETQVEAAASLGVPVKTYIDWEQGRRTPHGFTLQALLDRVKIRGKSVIETALEKSPKLVTKKKPVSASSRITKKRKRPRAQSRTRPARRTSGKK